MWDICKSDSIDPLSDQNSPSAEVHVNFGSVDSFILIGNKFFKFNLVHCFINKIELGIESLSPRFHESNVIGLIRRIKSLDYALD
jgi:hypothetical protein